MTAIEMNPEIEADNFTEELSDETLDRAVANGRISYVPTVTLCF